MKCSIVKVVSSRGNIPSAVIADSNYVEDVGFHIWNSDGIRRVVMYNKETKVQLYMYVMYMDDAPPRIWVSNDKDDWSHK